MPQDLVDNFRLTPNSRLSVLANANSRLGPRLNPEVSVTFNSVLQAAVRVAKTGMMILIFSDFHDVDDRSESLLRRLSAHNDVLLFPVSDPASSALPDNFRVVASDGDQQVTIDAAAKMTGEHIRHIAEARAGRLLALERKYGIAVLPLTAGESTEEQVLRLLSAEGQR